MVAPAISSIARDLNITNEVEQQLVLSVFILAYAIGPLFLVRTRHSIYFASILVLEMQ